MTSDRQPTDLEQPFAEKTPLLFGRYAVEPRKVLNIALIAYTGFFLLYRIADVVYLASLDARFPKGLGYFYPNEAERLQSVSYTKQSITLNFIQRTVNYVLVMVLVLSGVVARLDDQLRDGLSGMGNLGGEGGFSRVMGKCMGGCLAWAAKPCWLRCCCGWMPNWGRAFRGAIYLTLFATLFFAVSIPFKLWHFNLNVEFGFVNTLTVTPAMYKNAMYGQLWSTFTGSGLQLFLYLMVLQSRFGWFLMWFCLCSASLIAQYNMDILAPMIFNAKNLFPATEFGVARGYPWVQGLSPEAYFSVNRLFFTDPLHSGVYHTNDQSKGQFFLKTTASKPGQMGDWQISGASGKVYAQARRNTTFLDSIHDLEHLERQPWTVNDYSGEKVDAPEAAMGVRDGKALRDELDDFAKREKVSVGDVFMIDGSHQDARANAFVAGAGKQRVIGLYDTLFLGDHSTQKETDSEAPPSSADGGLNLQALSASLQKVDLSEEEEAPIFHKAPTQAMSDTEIMAILAHELGHAKFHDVEHNIVIQAFTSFATFATLGWMVQSPVVALSLGVLQPIGHVAIFAFDYVVGPVLDGCIKFMTDGITRQKEYVADAYAASINEGYATGLQTSLAKLTVNSNQDPDEPWFYEMLHADHPTFANRWYGIEEVKKELYGKNRKPAAFNQERLQPEG